MPRPRVVCLLLVGLILARVGRVRAGPDEPQKTPIKARDILEVIEALKAQFLRAQNPDGSWPEHAWGFDSSGVVGGHTALICWALLQAGQDPFSEPIHRAVNNLLTVNMAGTYNRSLRCMVLASLARIEPGGRYAHAMQTDTEFLLQGRMANGRWTYFNPATLKAKGLSTPDRNMLGDNSNTQFAVLGLREAAVAGAAVPINVWREIRDYWQSDQNEDGGFSYRKGDGTSYGSMTAAGVASLFIAEDMVRGAQCCAGELPEAISNALKWLSENFSATQNPRRGAYWPYWLYSIERVAETSGYRYFGEHDWFWEGAAAIVDAFRSGRLKVHGDLSEPAFALIFLAKSVAPMVCNKLDFGDAWNPNPLDAAHVTRYLSTEVFERHLNWQVLPLDSAMSLYQEAPLLLITTKKWPPPDDPLAAPLRAKVQQFCEIGGTLLVDHTCSPDSEFHGNFDAFLEEAWPGRRLRVLPGTHPLYSAHFPLKPNIGLQGLGNGCREYVLLCDSTPPTAATRPAGAASATQPAAPDLSCAWQKSLFTQEPAAFQIAANLYMYATDKSFRTKLEPRSSLPRDTGLATRALPVARLRYAGNWNPCPLALPMLGEVLQARAGFGLEVQSVTLGAPDLVGRKVLVITGQGKMEWTGEQIAILRDFIKSGGCVLADSLMGDREFAESLRRLAAAALMTPPRPIPDNDPLITGRFNAQAFNLERVHYSRTLRWRKGVAGPPSLEGIRQDKRWAFVISPYDLTNGLTTAKPYGMLGYEPDDATRIAANCMLYFAITTGFVYSNPQSSARESQTLVCEGPQFDLPASASSTVHYYRPLIRSRD
jgi:hypothetical protein